MQSVQIKTTEQREEKENNLILRLINYISY